ncbi:polyprenyl synthetase family protein [bacterium]|nr:polyprenyl synthetase family protein [bacterium]
MNAVTQLQSFCASRMEAVNDRITHAAGRHAELIPAIASHIGAAGGKRLRPMLTLACASLGGYHGQGDVPLAAAVEFIHTASLLHDDVVDESQSRRGKTTAHAIWGNKAAVLVGDFLFSKAFQCMVEAGSIEAIRALSDASAIISEGEVMQLESMYSLQITEADYYRVVEAKTSALFAAACEVGGIVAGKDKDFITRLYTYGQMLGTAFQLTDDWMDYASTGAAMGKDAGDDFREGKVTLPVLFAYKKSGQEERSWIQQAFSGDVMPDEASLGKMQGILHQTGALDAVKQAALAKAVEARKAILSITPAGGMEPLQALLGAVADACVERIA